MFCKTCGSLLKPKTTPYGKWLACPEGHPQGELNQDKNIISSKNPNLGKKIKVSDGINHLAVFDHKCKKCGYDKAEILELSASYSDEDNVTKMKCGKCGFVEQMEGKTT